MFDEKGDEDSERYVIHITISFYEKTAEKHFREALRVICQPVSEKESFQQIVTDKSLRTTLIYTNQKVKEVRKNHPKMCYSVKAFSKDEIQVELAIILKAERDRDIFIGLDDLWKPPDSKLFYRAVMDLHRFKFLLGCLRFDGWCTIPERKLMVNLQLFQKFEIFFSETLAWY